MAAVSLDSINEKSQSIIKSANNYINCTENMVKRKFHALLADAFASPATLKIYI